MNGELASVASSAIGLAGVVSAAIFIVDEGSGSLELAAAAGVDGVALERLTAAVRSPSHPIARTLSDAIASFDVAPVAPGGPALRSHVPLFAGGRGPTRAVGVLAVAHEGSLSASDRQVLTELAANAACLVGS